MRHKKYGKTLQKAMIKRGKTLQKAMIKRGKTLQNDCKKCGKTLQVQDFFRRSEGSLNAHFTQVCFFLNNARL